MQLKNLNPYVGLRQVLKGYFCIPRSLILHPVRNKTLTPSLLGYYIILYSSADWDVSEHRKGFIRHDLKDLAKIWNISVSTLRDNIKKLIKAGYLHIEQETLKITNFDDLTYSEASKLAKKEVTDENLHEIFENILQSNEKPLDSSTELPSSFRDSFKVESKGLLEDNNHSVPRNNKDYIKIYEEGDYAYLTPEDMRWLDENYDAQGRYIP
jgi:DNA-binding MarR family transcriptional regulator